MIRRPPRSTLFPTRRSSDLIVVKVVDAVTGDGSEESDPKMLQQALQEAVNEVEQEEDEHLRWARRSEEHTSELRSRQYLVCRLLLEKKNKYSTVIRDTKSID